MADPSYVSRWSIWQIRDNAFLVCPHTDVRQVAVIATLRQGDDLLAHYMIAQYDLAFLIRGMPGSLTASVIDHASTLVRTRGLTGVHLDWHGPHGRTMGGIWVG